MSPAGWLTVAILVAGAAILSWGRLRPDGVSLCILLALVFTGVLSPQRALSSFGSTPVLAIAGLYLVSAALEHTGAAALLGERLLRMTKGSPVALMASIMITVGVLSGFMKNLGAAAVLLPVVVGICHELDLAPSRLLLPMAIGARLGSDLTLIAGPSNLIASDLLRESRGIGFSLFEFLPLGGSFLIVGTLFFATIGLRLLPNRFTEAFLATRRARQRPPLFSVYRMQERLRECRVLDTSPLVGRSVAEAALGRDLGVTILAIWHRDQQVVDPSPAEVINHDDRLLVAGVRDEAQVQHLQEAGLEVTEPTDVTLESLELVLAEAVVAPRSAVVGTTLREMNFRHRYGVSVLAIWRRGEARRSRLSDVALEPGDALLLQGPRPKLRVLAAEPEFLVPTMPQARYRTNRMSIAALVTAAMAAVLATTTLDIAVVILATALALMAVGALTADEAYRAIDWPTVVIVGSLLPLGTALTETGVTGEAVRAVLDVARTPFGALAALYAFAIIVNQVVPSVAATVVLGPIALRVAGDLGVNPATFMMAVMAATATTFTPISNPVNLLVMAPGGYTVRDYLRVGLPLALILFVAGLLLLPLVWPLR